MRTLSFEEKYAAIGTRESQYEGLFITAVKTTGIFCRPSCRARKPKAENVVFYDNVQEAIQNGYRACKICKPMEAADSTPEYIQKLLQELQDDPFLKMKDQDLRDRKIEPSKIRRWFKKHYQMTFQAYQRMLRINLAYTLIQKGNSVTGTAFELGYESLSGFSEGYKNIFGDSARKSGNKQVIHIRRFTTSLGPMFAGATQKGICLLEFTDRKMLETEFKDLQKRLGAVLLPGQNPWLDQVQTEIKEYLAKKRKQFQVSLDSPGTEFQQALWTLLQKIPYGETATYKDLATQLGKPQAVRALGAANGANRIAIIIPCHRVIATNGELRGYGGGLARKKFLLQLEKENR